MDCSDLNRFLNNEMTDEEQKILKFQLWSKYTTSQSSMVL